MVKFNGSGKGSIICIYKKLGCMSYVIHVNNSPLLFIEIVVKTTTNLPISDILNSELSMVNNWLKVNKLSLNIKKSKYMIFHTNKKKSKV